MTTYTIVVALRPARTAKHNLVPGYEFLMVRNRRRGGTWELPGGRANPGETALACAEREFREETGARMEAPRLVQRRAGPLGDGHVYVCRPGPPTGIVDPQEIQGSRFFDRLPDPKELSFPDDAYPALFAAVRAALPDFQETGADPAGP